MRSIVLTFALALDSRELSWTQRHTSQSFSTDSLKLFVSVLNLMERNEDGKVTVGKKVIRKTL